jgi:hypothetical protein
LALLEKIFPQVLEPVREWLVASKKIDLVFNIDSCANLYKPVPTLLWSLSLTTHEIPKIDVVGEKGFGANVVELQKIT